MVESAFPSGPATAAPHRRRTSPLWRRTGAATLALALMGGSYAFVLAQVGGDRGIPPTASSADIEVTGIEVDVVGETGEEAREEAWKQIGRAHV